MVCPSVSGRAYHATRWHCRPGLPASGAPAEIFPRINASTSSAALAAPSTSGFPDALKSSGRAKKKTVMIWFVIAALVAAIPIQSVTHRHLNRDARDKRGHDRSLKEEKIA
jgi:hypothetical protein